MGQAATRLLGFLLIPLYTRFLTTDDYGILAVVLILPQILGDVSNLGIISAFYRFYFDTAIEENGLVISNTFLFNAVSTLITFALLAAGSSWVSELILGSGDYALLVQVLFAFLLARSQNDFAAALLRVERKAFLYSVITVVRVAVNLAATILLVARFHFGVLGVLLGQLVPEVLLLAFLQILVVAPRFRFGFSLDLLRRMVRFGLPLTPVSIASWVVNSVPVSVLARLSTLTESGLYSMGYKFGALILSFVVAPFQLGWSPIAYAKAGDSDAPRLYARVFTYLSAVLVFAVVGISLTAGDLIRLMATPAYYPAQEVVLAVALGAAAHGLYYFFSLLINIDRKTYLNTIIWSGALVIGLGMTTILAPKYGRIGVSWSYAAACIFVVLAGLAAARKSFPVPYEWRRLALVGAAGTLILAAGKAISTGALLPDLALHILITCLMPVVLLFSGFLFESEKQVLRDAAGSLRFKGKA